MCDNKDFVHLHLHTEYSLLDGFARIDKAVSYAKSLGMGSLAITDHGTMFGVMDFYRACKKHEVKPIIGLESYLARRSRFGRDPQLDSQPYHMLLLAKDMTGYKNLLKMASVAQLEGYYYRPRIDWDLMAECSEGIIATSGCLAAEIPRMVEAGKEDEARQLIGKYQDTFGKDNFFLELQSHDIPELERLNKWLLANKDFANVRLVATNDVHYVKLEDYDNHDTLLCIQTSSLKNDPKRMRMTDNSYHLRTQEEMWRIFGDIAPEALTNTLLIAEMCNLNLDDKKYHLPVFPVPAQFPDAGAYLKYLCYQGLEWRYGDHAHDPKVRERLDYELGVINKMGFDTYFLIVWDLCEFARHADIWWNVRGSGAGSVVAYTLGITSLDPLENNLLFERFLNPGRVSMPDFDLDYPEDRRAEMIEYCTRKYGEDKVAAIITFGTLGAKAAIKDVGRALEIPLAEVDRITRTVPTAAKIPKIPELIGDDPEKVAPDLKNLYQSDPVAKKIIDIAAAIEGVPRHASTHAAGVIVADRPLVEYLPLHRPTKGDNNEDNPVKMVTQFPMETAESIGLLKIDFLGLSTLTILRRACEMIEKYHGIHFDMENIPYKPDPNDPEISRKVAESFVMMSKGETVGVFQLESSGMRQTLTQVQPQTFEHIIAVISLYRPGPMDFIPLYARRMHGEEETTYHHQLLEPILNNTFGIMVYQEQLMQIGSMLFGYSLGEADLMRRAVSKKKAKDLAEHRQIFMERGPERGVDPEIASKIFDDIEFFANYGFNKSHAADYAVITCKSAYLKCHYPHEYMSALMSVYFDVSEKVSLFAADCRRMGIDVLPPDVNKSYTDFSIEEWRDGSRHIRFGLSAVKNLGLGAIEYILKCRGDQPFADLDDFVKRCDLREVGKRGVEALIQVGALDTFMQKGQRAFLRANLEKITNYSLEYHKNAATGQVSMFDLLGATVHDAGSVASAMTEQPPRDWDLRETLRWEKELVGLYVSEHPLNTIWGQLESTITHTTATLNEEAENLKETPVTIAGLLSSIRTVTTKKGDPMAIIVVEDIHGTVECVLFPKLWEKVKDMLVVDKVYVFRGKADLRGTDVNIKLDSVSSDFTITAAVEQQPMMASRLAQADLDLGLDIDEETGEIVRDVPEPAAPRPEPVIAPASAGATVNTQRLEPQLTSVSNGGLPEEPEDFRMAMDRWEEPKDIPPVADEWMGLDVPRRPATATRTAPALMDRTTGKLMAPPAPAAVPRLASKKLIIEMLRTDDSALDRRRLRLLHNSVKEYPGSDEFCIIVHQTDGKRLKMDFPAIKIKIHDKLMKELEQRDGVKRVYIETT